MDWIRRTLEEAVSPKNIAINLLYLAASIALPAVVGAVLKFPLLSLIALGFAMFLVLVAIGIAVRHRHRPSWEPKRVIVPSGPIPTFAVPSTSSTLVVPARLMKTELQSILARVDRLMKLDPTLTEDYLLPSEQWAAYRARLAALESYDRVAKAYQEIARVNDQWRWRREGAGTKRIGVNRENDGLDVLEAAAKDALAVLDEVIAGG